MNEERSVLKELSLLTMLVKMILKKVYNLNDTQYKRIIRAYESDAKEEVEEYLKGIENRSI